jgi:glutathione S-transferase
MILIGQYDSPFVRRVAIAMRLYGLGFEHRSWSTFGEGDEIAAFNPLRRVPTLVLDDGEALIESTAILDYLDEIAGADKAMIARTAASAMLENLRARDRPCRQGGQPPLRARAAQEPAIENLG